MRRVFWNNSIMLIIIICMMSACRSARRSEPLLQSAVAMTPESAEGKVVFQKHCHECHPGGEGGLGPALNDKPLPSFLIKTQVRRGFGVMPHFDRSDISSDELDQLTAYLAELRQAK